MPGANKKNGFCIEDDNMTLQSLKLKLKSRKKRAIVKASGNVRLKKKILNKAIALKKRTSKKEPSLSNRKAKTIKSRKREGEKEVDGDSNPRKLKRRRKKKRKNNVELDEASRLQRRTRYLLIKLKLEQNLIDAYAAEGWKGQSREKIKPEKELLRAREQILKCKLGIREAIHQLDLLSSEGCLNDFTAASAGATNHKNILCARCKSQKARCDSAMSSDDISPEGDDDWFCKVCEKRKEIIEATNAHLGTQFQLDSKWEDIFREEAALPDTASSMLFQQEEWPSDDSGDSDYDPIKINTSLCDGQPEFESESEASGYNSSFLGSLEDESGLASGEDTIRCSNNLLRFIEDSIHDDAVSGTRQRASVNYIKLYDEMFGKNAENEQNSEDEDWGPTKKKRRVKESDTDVKDKDLKNRTLRLPTEAVEKLRLVFSENELPERALRVDLSRKLGLELDKVNKWFKNARYLSLKTRKAGKTLCICDTKQAERTQTSQSGSKKPDGENGNDKAGKFSNSLERKYRRKCLLVKEENSQKTNMDLGDDVSLKYLRDEAREAKKKWKEENRRSNMVKGEGDMEEICRLKRRVEKMQQILLQLPIRKLTKSTGSKSSIMYVPVAEVREKR